MMKSCDGGSAGRPENRLTARSNEPHQALTGVERPRYGARNAARTSAALRRGGEVARDLRGRRRWRAPRPRRAASLQGTSCGVGSISTGPASSRDRRQHARASPRRPDGPASARSARRARRCARRPPRGVRRSSATDERAGAVGRRQRQRLPAARAQPQRRVLELGLRGRKRRSQLPEHLRVGVERVEGRMPLLVRQRRPVSHRKDEGWRSRPASCVRDLTSSLRNTLRRWYSTCSG